jgi:hypothetical protein
MRTQGYEWYQVSKNCLLHTRTKVELSVFRHRCETGDPWPVWANIFKLINKRLQERKKKMNNKPENIHAIKILTWLPWVFRETWRNFQDVCYTRITTRYSSVTWINKPKWVRKKSELSVFLTETPEVFCGEKRHKFGSRLLCTSLDSSSDSRRGNGWTNGGKNAFQQFSVFYALFFTVRLCQEFRS